MKKHRQPPIEKVDYDTNLKEIITEFFPDALALLHPDLAALVDWSRPPEFLEQELRRLHKAHFKETKLCDLLVKLWLLDGRETWVLLHLEIETAPTQEFGKRMFEYLMLIIIKHRIYDVAAMALYAGEKSPNQVDCFEHSFVGTSITYKFNVFKAWEQDEASLLASTNPFALVILAIQYVLKTKGKFEDRMLFKEKLFELAQQKKMEEQKLARLVIFVDNFVFLPSEWEEILKSKLATEPLKKAEMTITQSTRDLAEIMYKRAFGTLPQEMAEKIIAEKTAENAKEYEAIRKEVAEIKRIVAQVMKKEAEAKKKEAEAKKKEAEAKKKETEAKKKAKAEEKEKLAAHKAAETMAKKSVLALDAIGQSTTEIAKSLGLNPTEVEDILKREKRLPKE